MESKDGGISVTRDNGRWVGERKKKEMRRVIDRTSAEKARKEG